MSKRMEREAVILCLRTDDNARKTGKGAVFVGKEACDFNLRQLRELGRGQDAPFYVDWKDEDGDILDTFGIDEAGFRALVGEEPESPEFYAAYDAEYWEKVSQLGDAIRAKEAAGAA